MLKKFLLYSLFGGIPFAASAQYNFGQINNPHTHNLASAQLPSLLGDDLKSGEFHLLNLYAGFGNNLVSAGDLQTLSESGNLSNEFIDGFLARTPKQAAVWAGLDLPLLNIFFQVKKKNKPFLFFGLGMRQKIDINATLNKDLLTLIYKGNKGFSGQTVNLSPSLNMLYSNEYFLSMAGQISIPDIGAFKTLSVKPAARFRLISGMAALAMPEARINMYTDPEGRFIDFSTSLQANLASAIDTPDIQSTFGNLSPGSFRSAGRGFGMDLGVGIIALGRIRVHLGLLDIGSIRFTRNAVNYTRNSSYRYEGIDLNGAEEGNSLSTGNLEELIQPEKTYQSFNMALPTKLVFSGAYLMKKKTRRKVDYHAHNVQLTYVQGFRNYLNATRTPALNLGYTYNFVNVVCPGVHVTMGGLNGLMAGAQVGFRLGMFKMGLGSNNLLPLISSSSGRGTDANLYLGFYF